MSANAQTIESWLKTHAAHQPDKVALRCAERSWTYRALADWVEGLAAWISYDLNLKPGERIALYGHNSAEQVALFFAAAKLGLTVVPLNWRLAPNELQYVMEDCTPRVLFHGPEFERDARALTHGSSTRRIRTDQLGMAFPKEKPRAELDNPFLIVYTSGTTGQPKGAVHTQEAVFWNAVISLHAHDFTASDHVLNILPLFHVGGINIQMMPCFFAGGTVTLHAGFDPGATINALEWDGITSTVCVPTVMRALMAHPRWADARFPDLRMLNTGSTDVPVDILTEVNARGIPMVQVYGATETGPIATYQRAAEAAATVGSIGRPAAHCLVKTVRSDGSDCDTDEPGEIWVKGPNNFSHYWNNKPATEAALVDGWFRTGDIARKDDNGLFWFDGRLKHVIISGGENIYTAEIERLYATLAGVIEVAVVGRPDARWGEVPVLVAVVKANGPNRDDLLNICKDKIARFKQPKDVVFVKALPKNALGKVIVADIRQLVAEVADADLP